MLPVVGPVTPELAKQPATWVARAALAGHQLRRLEPGRWLAHKHGWSRELDETEVEAWLRRVEGRVA